LVGKLKGKRPIAKPRRKWEDNIKMNLTQVGRAGFECIIQAHDTDRSRTLVNTLVPTGSIKCSEFLEQLRDWRHLKDGLSSMELVKLNTELHTLPFSLPPLSFPPVSRVVAFNEVSFTHQLSGHGLSVRPAQLVLVLCLRLSMQIQ
jgi:hypothetical protein